MKALLILTISCFSFIVSAQIIYTDIPDTILIFPENEEVYTYFFDINNDTMNALKFNLQHHEEFVSYHTLWVVYTASIKTFDSIVTSGNGCVFVLTENDTINETLEWSDSFSALLFGREYYEDIWEMDDWWCNLPNSNKYCGLKLTINGNIHYGWLCLSWNTSSVVIKDFAYNSTPEMMILAGQTESSAINEDITYDLFNISKYNGQLEIKSNREVQEIDKVRIFNLSGQCIRDKEIKGQKASLNINNLQTGIYIINIITPGNIYVQKYYISN